MTTEAKYSKHSVEVRDENWELRIESIDVPEFDGKKGERDGYSLYIPGLAEALKLNPEEPLPDLTAQIERILVSKARRTFRKGPRRP